MESKAQYGEVLDEDLIDVLISILDDETDKPPEKVTKVSDHGEMINLAKEAEALEDIAKIAIRYDPKDIGKDMTALRHLISVFGDIDSLKQKEKKLKVEHLDLLEQISFEKSLHHEDNMLHFNHLADVLDEINELHVQNRVQEKLDGLKKLETQKAEIQRLEGEALKLETSIQEVQDEINEFSVRKAHHLLWNTIHVLGLRDVQAVSQQVFAKCKFFVEHKLHIWDEKRQLISKQSEETYTSKYGFEVNDEPVVPLQTRSGDLITKDHTDTIERFYFQTRAAAQRKYFDEVEEQQSELCQSIKSLQRQKLHLVASYDARYPHSSRKCVVLHDSRKEISVRNMELLSNLLNRRQLVYEVMDISTPRQLAIDIAVYNVCLAVVRRHVNPEYPQVFIVDQSQLMSTSEGDKIVSDVKINRKNLSFFTNRLNALYIGKWMDLHALDLQSNSIQSRVLQTSRLSRSRLESLDFTLNNVKDLEGVFDDEISSTEAFDERHKHSIPTFSTVFRGVARSHSLTRKHRIHMETKLLETENKILVQLEDVKARNTFQSDVFRKELSVLESSLHTKKALKLEIKRKEQLLSVKKERANLRVQAIQKNLDHRRRQWFKDMDAKKQYHNLLSHQIFENQKLVLETFPEVSSDLLPLRSPLSERDFYGFIQEIFNQKNIQLKKFESLYQNIVNVMDEENERKSHYMKDILRLQQQDLMTTEAINSAKDEIQSLEDSIETLNSRRGKWVYGANSKIHQHKSLMSHVTDNHMQAIQQKLNTKYI